MGIGGLEQQGPTQGQIKHADQLQKALQQDTQNQLKELKAPGLSPEARMKLCAQQNSYQGQKSHLARAEAQVSQWEKGGGPEQGRGPVSAKPEAAQSRDTTTVARGQQSGIDTGSSTTTTSRGANQTQNFIPGSDREVGRTQTFNSDIGNIREQSNERFQNAGPAGIQAGSIETSYTKANIRANQDSPAQFSNRDNTQLGPDPKSNLVGSMKSFVSGEFSKEFKGAGVDNVGNMNLGAVRSTGNTLAGATVIGSVESDVEVGRARRQQSGMSGQQNLNVGSVVDGHVYGDMKSNVQVGNLEQSQGAGHNSRQATNMGSVVNSGVAGRLASNVKIGDLNQSQEGSSNDQSISAGSIR